MQVHQFRIPYSSVNDEFNYFLASDLHIDNAAFDKALLKRELDEAVAHNARIFLNGDIFDMIVPSDLKRYRKGQDVLPQRDDFVNEIVRQGHELLKPYADYIDIIGVGNHEAEYMKRTNYDPVSGLITLLQQDTEHPIKHGGYEGFIVLAFERADGSGVRRYTIYYNHGQGGGAEVTMGIIGLTRRGYIRSNLVWLGHNHTRIALMLPPDVGVDQYGNVYVQERKGVKTGSYTRTVTQYDATNEGYRGSYGSERMRTPQYNGGVLLTVRPRLEGAEGRLLI